MYIGDQTDWGAHVHSAFFAYQTSEHVATKTTPYGAVFIRTSRIPINLQYPMVKGKITDVEKKLMEIRSKLIARQFDKR